MSRWMLVVQGRDLTAKLARRKPGPKGGVRRPSEGLISPRISLRLIVKTSLLPDHAIDPTF
jgi:hypothetical protein